MRGLWGRRESRFPIALSACVSQIWRAPISVRLTHFHALHLSSYGLIEAIICLLERHVCVPRVSEVLICRQEPHEVQHYLLPSSHPSFSEDRSYPQTALVNIQGLDILIIEEYKYHTKSVWRQNRCFIQEGPNYFLSAEETDVLWCAQDAVKNRPWW